MQKEWAMTTRIISFINQKGGVGKTTTTAHIGYALAAYHSQRVLLIDYDAQSNLSMLFGVADNPAVAQALQTGKISAVEVRPNLHLLPSTTDFVALEPWMHQHPKSLQIALESVKGKYDYVLIDCPPSTNIVPETALHAASDVVIIANGEPYSLAGFSTITQFVSRIQSVRPRLTISGVIMTRFDKRKALCREVAEVLKAEFPAAYFDAPVREIQAVVDALASGKTVFEYKKTSLAVQDFKHLTELFHKRFQSK